MFIFFRRRFPRKFPLISSTLIDHNFSLTFSFVAGWITEIFVSNENALLAPGPLAETDGGDGRID